MDRLAYRLGNDTSFSQAVWLFLKGARDVRGCTRRRPLIAPAVAIALTGVSLPLLKLYDPAFLSGHSPLAGLVLCFVAGMLLRLEKFTELEGKERRSASQRQTSLMK